MVIVSVVVNGLVIEIMVVNKVTIKKIVVETVNCRNLTLVVGPGHVFVLGEQGCQVLRMRWKIETIPQKLI